MAQIEITKILDGPRNAVFHVAIAGTGEGDLAGETIIDPATSFDPPMDGQPTISVDRLWYDLTGFDARLDYEYLASNTPCWSMSGGQAADMDFCVFGSLKDRSNPLDGSGKLVLTTSGLGNGDRGTIIVKVRKD